MRCTLTSKPPCALRRGDLRRVPQRAGSRLVGYHLGCPRCGFPNIVLDGTAEQQIAEEPGLVTLGPVRCTYCGVAIRLVRSIALLEEVPGVRPVVYR